LEAHLENHRRSSVERHSGARVEADMETGVGPNEKARWVISRFFHVSLS
jgi:hypothetical protein